MILKVMRLFLILVLLLPCQAFAQIGAFLNKQSFNWASWEVRMTDSAKLEFLNGAPWNLNLTSVDPEGSKYHIVRLDGDTLPDLIGQDGNNNEVMLNRNDSYETVFETNDPIINLSRLRPWNPLTIYTNSDRNEGTIMKVFTPIYMEGNLEYEESAVYHFHPEVELQKENLPPSEVEFINVPELRWSPDAQQANIIKTYKFGERGFAVASTQARFEYNWWMVVVPEGGNVFRVGWMRSAYLKRIKR